MKILLFGKNGQVGYELARIMPEVGEIVSLGRKDAEFSDPESLRPVVQKVRPDIIVNAVAYTAVDQAEVEEKIASVINSDAPRVLAEEASRLDALLVHYSTDYVFDGSKEAPYLETDQPSPINAYGRTKLAGERAIQTSGCDYLIFRTAWVYARRGHNFLLTMIRLMHECEELNVVNDQFGTPTSAELISEITVHCMKNAMIQRGNSAYSSGLFNLTASGYTSWHGFAMEILSELRKLDDHLAVKKINPVSSSEYPAVARRPSSSRLSTRHLEASFNVVLPDWKTDLLRCFSEI